MKALLGKLIDVKLGLLENNEDMLPVIFPSETISIVCSCVLKVKAFGCMGFANKFPELEVLIRFHPMVINKKHN